ncbi:MAG: hypothetical protein SWO11_14330 [Thermodesulfobacteriota bacterium]|nr:hypothetical protein [Thermodesulfobacteriota bacterium]
MEAKAQVRARDLLYYWTVVELAISRIDMARRFDITPAAVSYSVQRRGKWEEERATNWRLRLFN